MSSDNGVYVLKTRKTTPKGISFRFRVAEIGAMDNLDYGVVSAPDILTNAKKMWGNVKVYRSKTAALVEAHELADTIDVLEYGVNFIDLSDESYGEW